MNYKHLLTVFGSASVALAACNPTKGDNSIVADGGSLVIDGGPRFGSANQVEDGGNVSGNTAIATSGEDSGVVEGTPCRARTLIEKLDLLFVVDNSNSMREEQAALQAQFPKLIRTLTTGERFPGDPDPFPAATDLHLAVVSTDMGLIGVNGIMGCEGFGGDGIMHDPTNYGCEGGKPGERFLSYAANSGDSDALATNFACLANLGTGGCGFEQQLESALKAVWPSVDVDPLTGATITPNRVMFLKDATGMGGLGHGDLENKGFLRNDFSERPSLLGVVLVTDEEDCSSVNTSHFRPMAFLDAADPNYNVDLNLRCLKNPQNLHPVTRYSTAFKALRAGNEDLFMFGAIVGVPPALVDASARAGVNFSVAASRNAYYDGILAHPRMQPTVDPTREPGNGNLLPSCDTPSGRAYPPVRIVQLAKEIGENSVVQSICQDDFGPAMDAIIDRVGVRLQDICLLE